MANGLPCAATAPRATLSPSPIPVRFPRPQDAASTAHGSQGYRAPPASGHTTRAPVTSDPDTDPTNSRPVSHLPLPRAPSEIGIAAPRRPPPPWRRLCSGSPFLFLSPLLLHSGVLIKQRKWLGFLLMVLGACVQGFTKSLAMTVLSEVGDKTFFAAAILAMRHPRKLVLAGCLTALIVMTALSASLGWVAPNLISRKWTHHVTTLLFFVFGIWSLWEGFKEDGDSEELAEVEAELDAVFKSNKGESKTKTKANDDTKKQQRPFLMQFFSPIFIKAFSITFFGEWGDKSQIATIGLAADENPFGVVLGGIIAQALCTTAAVLGGKSLASQISEKMVELSSGVLFLLFGIMSLLSGPGEL
ncbi:GDT1-like protein 4 [Zea mays]|uniref:GDT1 family protein n=4 Tax=Zea mays TaxID=4577 RepID=A0A1D6Q1H4_MAIZE|nr:GDT1-like protein 4 [Zea mays]AQK52471.1 GDT1-like protein 4 [Zea mays]